VGLALVHSRARAGVTAPPVQVEVHLSGGLPSTQIVGLPAAAVRESRDRVRAAILCAQFEYPQRRITINLAPADLPRTVAASTCPSPWASSPPAARSTAMRWPAASSSANWA